MKNNDNTTDFCRMSVDTEMTDILRPYVRPELQVIDTEVCLFSLMASGTDTSGGAGGDGHSDGEFEDPGKGFDFEDDDDDTWTNPFNTMKGGSAWKEIRH